jgi:UDP-4-amino-4,6-dideoxy-N-acetyl-beta-L-altrosamine N-acetyltransferase
MIALRDIRPEDKELIRGWRNLPEVALYMYRDHTIFPEEHERWLSEKVSDPTRRYWIISQGEENFGLANLYQISVPDRRCSWAFYVAHPGARGRGVGMCAEYLILTKVFDEMKFNRLCCEVLASNRGVIEMHRRFGFVREGYFRQHVIKGGGPVDVVSLAMLRDEWEKKKSEILFHLQEKGLLMPERSLA